MILSIMDWLEEISNKISSFVGKNFDNPFFWVIVFGVLLAIGIYGISKLADK